MWKWYVHWNSWAFGKVFRLNSSLMWGINPYMSYRFGPIEVRKYELK
jgi:hypothetical protein